ncbi:MAG: hypothetical protein ACD_19C00264G0002 [uncultured bacterium]|nr:MAG: hypothetical protein ACD_19C00264G0002 [uncultured bacterium]
MSKVETLHNKAMDIAEEAFLAKKTGEEQKAIELFGNALIYEQEAASLLNIAKQNEPTRSILYRSSAALAHNSHQFDLAERLISNGLAGFPPNEIKEELKNLYEDVNFMRHLSIKGLSLTNDQWIMSLYGNCTSFGATAADHLMMRVDRISALFYRTVERLLKLPYRIHGGVNKEIRENFGLYINAFVPRSFAVSFQIGRPDPQLKLFPNCKKQKQIEPSEVINEVLNCFELFENDKPVELKERFDDEFYYENFVGLAKQMAPDGEDIKIVGFNSKTNGKERPVALRKKRKSIPRVADDNVSKSAVEQNEYNLTGTLMHANTPLKGNFGSVKLRSLDDKVTHNILVPISLMKDVVQPFYEEDVIIQGHKIGKKLFLDEISPNHK